MSTTRHLLRIDRATGRECPGPITAEELLARAHRGGGPIPLAAGFLASRLASLTGSEWPAATALRALRRVGDALAAGVGTATGNPDLEKVAQRLLGMSHRQSFLRFRDLAPASEKARRARLQTLRQQARAARALQGPHPRVRVLLTGATGFLGKEILAQAAEDPHLEEVVCLVRPRRWRDRRSGRQRAETGARRGAALLRRLGIQGGPARKFRFVQGDVEKAGLGLRAAERRRLTRTLTHVVHCAASVSFDDDYGTSFRANVLGSRNVLGFSLAVQNAPSSRFVAHVAIETSYVHGRVGARPAREGSLEFPRHYYNNFYELTKALATLETERAMWERGLRVIQLLPSIVIGDSRTGATRGDTKVVNAPINAFGRVQAAVASRPPGPAAWVQARLVALLGTAFPADASAELNLVPVDRVAAGVVASLAAPDAVGERIHLATHDRIRVREMAHIVGEEVGIPVRIIDPTLTRLVALPLARVLLTRLGQERLALSLQRLAAIFGLYGEWGQPVHAVGADVRTLALPARRPDTGRSLRMLCRYDRYVMRFGAVRDEDDLARRDAVWRAVVDDLEYQTGRAASTFPPDAFRRLLEARVDLHTFRLHRAPGERDAA